MNSELTMPKTLQEATPIHSDTQTCHDLMVQARWADGVKCPRCQSERVTLFATRPPSTSATVARSDSPVKVGTIFEDSPLGLNKWLPALWLISNCKNGISSCELARDLGVTQKTAWSMLHRIRYAMALGSFEKMSGTVEADETFIGGIEKNKHKNRRLNKGRGAVGKDIVAGLLERTGRDAAKGAVSQVRAKVVKNTKGKTLKGNIAAKVMPGAEVFTDAFSAYQDLQADYVHEFVDHVVKYVRGTVHTNGLENYWSLLKRTIKGTYVAIDVPHLNSYIDEQTFRFNHRKDDDGGRFVKVAKSVSGKRLTYKQLICR